MRTIIYYNTTKAYSKESYKKPDSEVSDSLLLLRNFSRGVAALNDDCYEYVDLHKPKGDLAVIFGYGRPRIEGAPLLGSFQAVRNEIIDMCEKRGTPVVCLDSGLFISYKHKRYWRVGLGSPLNDGDFFDADYDEKRAQKVQEDTGIYMKPYRESGEYIIICLQPAMNWSMQGKDPVQWANDKIARIREYTDMPIHVRNHPGDPGALDRINLIGDTRTYKNGKAPLYEHCKRAHAVVLYNSTAATDALAEGVPVFVDNPECHAWQVANTDINNILQPELYDRTDWFNRMCYRLWTYEELADGTVLQRIKNHLEIN